MIVFDLKCREGHVAEAWFGSSADYEAQKARGLITCPVCDSPEVEKAVMAPALATASAGSSQIAELRQAIARLRRAVEACCDYVGPDFPAEARARHKRDDISRGVWGEASLEETRALLEEGIPVLPLPFGRTGRTDG